jgi:hypothetical protein
MAYSNNAEVGVLPGDIRLIGLTLGFGYAINPKRVPVLLSRLCNLGWLDLMSDGRYKIHDWEQWQASKYDEYEPINNQQSINSQSTVTQHMLTMPIDNNDVAPTKSKSKSKNSLLRNDSQASLFEDDFEAGINAVVVTEIKLREERKRQEALPGDECYQALLDTIEQSWMEDRELSISIISDKTDYIALHALLRRVIPAGFTLGVLQAAWARFMVSTDHFHRNQAHPIRFFCSNLGSFLSASKSRQVGGKESAGDRASRDVLAMLDLP